MSEMGIKARKALKKSLQNKSAKLSIATAKMKYASSSAAYFLPLEGGGRARKLPTQTPMEDTATVLYLGRIPHGFHEDEMRVYFAQFDTVKRLRLSRNKKVS